MNQTKHTHQAITVGLLALATAVLCSAAPQLRIAPADMLTMPHSGGAGTSLVASMKTTVLAGDPTRPGQYTIRVELPPNTRIQAHSHRDERSAVVVSGIWYFGYGPKFDAGAMKTLPAGSFYTEPAGEAHFAMTKSEPVVIYITGTGPSSTDYVDPADNPAR